MIVVHLKPCRRENNHCLNFFFGAKPTVEMVVKRLEIVFKITGGGGKVAPGQSMITLTQENDTRELKSTDKLKNRETYIFNIRDGVEINFLVKEKPLTVCYTRKANIKSVREYIATNILLCKEEYVIMYDSKTCIIEDPKMVEDYSDQVISVDLASAVPFKRKFKMMMADDPSVMYDVNMPLNDGEKLSDTLPVIKSCLQIADYQLGLRKVRDDWKEWIGDDTLVSELPSNFYFKIYHDSRIWVRYCKGRTVEIQVEKPMYVEELRVEYMNDRIQAGELVECDNVKCRRGDVSLKCETNVLWCESTKSDPIVLVRKETFRFVVAGVAREEKFFKDSTIKDVLKFFETIYLGAVPCSVKGTPSKIGRKKLTELEDSTKLYDLVETEPIIIEYEEKTFNVKAFNDRDSAVYKCYSTILEGREIYDIIAKSKNWNVDDFVLATWYGIVSYSSSVDINQQFYVAKRDVSVRLDLECKDGRKKLTFKADDRYADLERRVRDERKKSVSWESQGTQVEVPCDSTCLFAMIIMDACASFRECVMYEGFIFRLKEDVNANVAFSRATTVGDAMHMITFTTSKQVRQLRWKDMICNPNDYLIDVTKMEKIPFIVDFENNDIPDTLHFKFVNVEDESCWVEETFPMNWTAKDVLVVIEKHWPDYAFEFSNGHEPILTDLNRKILHERITSDYIRVTFREKHVPIHVPETPMPMGVGMPVPEMPMAVPVLTKMAMAMAMGLRKPETGTGMGIPRPETGVGVGMGTPRPETGVGMGIPGPEMGIPALAKSPAVHPPTTYTFVDNGDEYGIDVPWRETVGWIRNYIAEKEAIKQETITLTYRGKLLYDVMKLDDFRIPPTGKIVVYIRDLSDIMVSTMPSLICNPTPEEAR